MDGRRWDVDERGRGVASGRSLSPNVEELAAAMRTEGWVAEEPDVHLVPHLESACSEPDSPWTMISWAVEDGVLVVDLTWNGAWGSWDLMRAEVYSVLGRISEHSSHIRQRTFEDRVDYEMATGTLGGETPFVPHGHLVRLRVGPASLGVG